MNTGINTVFTGGTADRDGRIISTENTSSDRTQRSNMHRHRHQDHRQHYHHSHNNHHQHIHHHHQQPHTQLLASHQQHPQPQQSQHAHPPASVLSMDAPFIHLVQNTHMATTIPSNTATTSTLLPAASDTEGFWTVLGTAGAYPNTSLPASASLHSISSSSSDSSDSVGEPVSWSDSNSSSSDSDNDSVADAATPASSSTLHTNAAVVSPLHVHITQFLRWQSPTPADTLSRRAALQRISSVIYQLWGESVEVHVIGSFATQLFLPDSDLDLVVRTATHALYLQQSNSSNHIPRTTNTAIPAVHSLAPARGGLPRSLSTSASASTSTSTSRSPSPSPAPSTPPPAAGPPPPPRPLPPLTVADLHHLGNCLHPLCSSLNIISTASVPLIKLIEAQSNFTVDITLNIDSGIASTELVLHYLHTYPLLKPLTIVLKQFLKARALNDLYTGGLPSYTLILMIVSMIQVQQQAMQMMLLPGPIIVPTAELADLALNGTTPEADGQHIYDTLYQQQQQQQQPQPQQPLQQPQQQQVFTISDKHLHTSNGSAEYKEELLHTLPPTHNVPLLSPAHSSTTTLFSASPPIIPPPVSDLGVCLLSFFYLYGYLFPYETHGISLRHAGPHYFLKLHRGYYNPHHPGLLCIESPIYPILFTTTNPPLTNTAATPTGTAATTNATAAPVTMPAAGVTTMVENDLGFKVFRIGEIRHTFAQAYQVLRDQCLQGEPYIQALHVAAQLLIDRAHTEH